ncbi:OVARIAN TUMOR DOMAIN-containing deubiquitinating enzyme 10 [Orobanche hederae]
MPKSRIKSRRLDGLNDHERLQDRLEWEGFSDAKIPADGNCQFRSLADQLFKTSDYHKQVRQEIVNQLKSCPQSYKRYVPMDFSVYLKSMSKNGEWGDHVTLQAAADAFRVKIIVITSFRDTSSIEILPKSQKFDRVVYLSFRAEVHYNSIHLNGGSATDTTSMELERKNKKEKEKEKNKREK